MARHGRRSWRVWFLVGVGAVLLLLVVDGFLAVRSLSSDLRTARDSLERAAELLERGQVVAARGSFEEARRAAESAESALRRPAARLAGMIPGIGDDVDAVDALTRTTVLAVGAGRRLADAAAAAGWDGTSIPGVEPGRVDLDVLAAAAPALQDAAGMLGQAQDAIGSIEPGGKLGPIAEVVRGAKEVIGERARQAERAADLLTLLPGLLGEGGERTYAIVMMTLSDPRGSGGYPGSFGVLRVSDGELSLEELAPTDELGHVAPVAAPGDVVRRYARFGGLRHFISSTYSPDWPTSAQIWMRMWEASGREPLDGVIGADSVWMSHMLQAIGPVDTPAWPEAITSDNVNQILDADTMLTVDEAASDAWQAGIATSLWLAMVTRSPAAQGFVDAISHATAERHLQVYSADPEDEALLEELGASGRVEMPENPLAVSWSGFVGSRTGYFAEKAIEYRAVVNEDGTADVTIAVTLMNNAPLEPESILLGTEADSFDVGEYAAAASVYLPSEATRIRSKVDGGGSLVKLFEREFDRRVVLTVLVAKSGHATTAEISYRMPVQLGVFELGIVPQPELRPTPVTVEITFPEGVRFADISPNLAAEGAALHYDGVPRIPLTLWARTLG